MLISSRKRFEPKDFALQTKNVSLPPFFTNRVNSFPELFIVYIESVR